MTLRDHLLDNPLLKYQNNIFYEKDLHLDNAFEGVYLKLRIKENRIHSDDVVRHLPDGFAVQFVQAQNRQDLNRLLVRAPRP